MKRMVLLSGGIDSSTCLALAKQDGAEVIAVNVFYGQRHACEAKSAEAIAAHYGVSLRTLNLADVFTGSDCPLLESSGRDIPHSTYREQTHDCEPVSTYVPFRNGLMLAAVASMALSMGASEVWYGAHADDAAGGAYPDCSEDFLYKMNAAVIEGTAGKCRVVDPIISMTKAEVVRTGLALGVPYELTWSCYEGGDKACGKCASCLCRKEAFAANGVDDPALK